MSSGSCNQTAHFTTNHKLLSASEREREREREREDLWSFVDEFLNVILAETTMAGIINLAD